MQLTLKHRPKCFAEVIGQNTVTSILQRQIATGKFKNVYLFSGAFGTGKTTCARIMANEINHGDGSPIEIDGASNNGVDNVRALIQDAQQSSIESDYKVYIIDEAQEFSKQAWDAMLKLIEEPPSHTVFIFCTTNPEKFPETILSRVQRFDFKAVSKDVIADRLEYIMNEEEHKNYERTALERIAYLSNGHVRDAVSLLERCLDVDDNLTLDVVEATLGLVKLESMENIHRAIMEKNLSKCLTELNNVRAYNTDFLYLYDQFTSYALDCAICSKVNNAENVMVVENYRHYLSQNSNNSLALVQRLLSLRKNVTKDNAEVILKTIFIELCD